MCILIKLLYLLTLTALLTNTSPICANNKKCDQLLEHFFLSIMNCLYHLTLVLRLWMLTGIVIGTGHEFDQIINENKKMQ